jgi:hypothetical protein
LYRKPYRDKRLIRAEATRDNPDDLRRGPKVIGAIRMTISAGKYDSWKSGRAFLRGNATSGNPDDLRAVALVIGASRKGFGL